ncbi:MAG: outer membrane lipoprotein carrier protein LolA [Alphaproteobacteria bacterium]|nr:outer membrane lipoprotein carrier protein LolA [Alphaproteobacteria bacterium]
MMRSSALLIGAFMLLAPAAWAQSSPTLPPAPIPKAKAAAPTPPAAVPNGAAKAQADAAQQQQQSPPAGSGLFPFKFPGFGDSGPTTSFDAKQRALIDRVNIYLMSVQTMTGDFVQVGPDGRRAEGKIFLQKPGRIRFEYNPPSPIELVADGNSLVVRDRMLATQDLYPLSQTPLRFLLADRIDLLRETNVTSVAADDTFISLQIEEKHTLGGTHKVLLMFSTKDTQLKQWTVTDPQGYDTTVALYNLDLGKKLDPAMFVINYERKEIVQ